MAKKRPARAPYKHPVNQALIDSETRGDRVADAVTAFMGSWRFIIIQTAIVALWVAGNIYLLFHFDPYPFIFLNLAFSTQAAYAAPLILLASNRSAGPGPPDAGARGQPVRRRGEAERAAPRRQHRDPQAGRGPGAADPRTGGPDRGDARGAARQGRRWQRRRRRTRRRPATRSQAGPAKAEGDTSKTKDT